MRTSLLALLVAALIAPAAGAQTVTVFKLPVSVRLVGVDSQLTIDTSAAATYNASLYYSENGTQRWALYQAASSTTFGLRDVLAGSDAWSVTTGAGGTLTLARKLAVSGASPGGLTQETWTAFSYGTNWAAFGGSYITPGYYKDSNGTVHLRGLIKTSAAQAAGSTLFTLPTGYRASAVMRFGPSGNIAGTDASVVVEAFSSGPVLLNAAALINSYVSLDGISFDTR
jgi:hypothetical protein